MVSMKEIVAPHGEQPATSPTVAVSPPWLDAVRLTVV